MRSVYLLFLPTLSSVVTGDGFMARRQGSELNLRSLPPEDTSIRSLKHEKCTTCGKDVGSCPSGQCCSESGKCGTSKDYCTSPQCQIPYSNGNCDSSKKPSGETTANIPRQTSGTVPYNVYITNCSESGTVALTFDDGPYKYTDHILDVLEENNVKATFFIVGSNLGKGQIDDESTPWPRILRRMHSAGHQLASHSWSHEDLSAATDEVRRQQMVYNEMAFRNVFGWFPRYLRPPYGTCTRASGCLDYVARLGYHVVNWNVDTRDYQHDSPGEIQTSKDIFSDGVSAHAKSHSYIELSHDVHRQTAYNLTSFMIKTLRERGYRAVTVGECLGDPPKNWYVDAGGGNPSASDYDPPSSSPSTTKDGTCGARSAGLFKCPGSKYGDCCSYAGFCGSVSGYCDGGCQPEFGKCNTWIPGDGLIVSDNGLCGDRYHQTCEGSRYGDCCSRYGNCGKTDAYCGRGCQKGFGTCSEY